MELASGLSFPKIKRHRVVGNADHPVFVSSAELRPREIVGEDGFVGPALLGQRFCTPLAQAHTVAVAVAKEAVRTGQSKFSEAEALHNVDTLKWFPEEVVP